MIARTLIAVAAIAVGLAAVAFAARAPSSAKPPGSIGDQCGVFPRPGADVPADAPSLSDQRAWNQNISQAPLDPNSDAIIRGLPGDLHPDFGSPRAYGIPYKVVGKNAKRVKVKFTAYGDESDHGKYRIPLNAGVEGGSKSDGDRHVVAYDKKRCELYELYRAFPSKKKWKADGGVIWDLSSADLRTEGWTSADAAGLPIFPGLVRYDEVAAGHLDHAIRLTFASTRNAWIHPASHCAGDTSSPDVPAMGTRMRLRSGYDLSSLTGGALVIAEAMKTYGMIVADNGSDWYFSGSSDPRWDDENLNQLKAISGSAFEVVRSEAETHEC